VNLVKRPEDLVKRPARLLKSPESLVKSPARFVKSSPPEAASVVSMEESPVGAITIRVPACTSVALSCSLDLRSPIDRVMPHREH